MSLASFSDFPIYKKKNAICTALKKSQVVIVAGETGSGKSIMLPFFCRELGLCEQGKIAITEPRRIAATSLAHYAACIDGSPLGKVIGFSIRYRHAISGSTRICYMTDGILMSHVQRNPYLRGYSVVMIDEAHERTLSMDFLLGYLRIVLQKRPDLSCIIASATLNTTLFQKKFIDTSVVSIENRRYHVSIRYQPVVQLWKGIGIDSYIEGVVHTIEQIIADQEQGDILVFLPTIDDVAETVRRIKGRIRTGVRVMPLHSRISYKHQAMIYARYNERKIVVSTNIAETSITVPGIRFVIDSGLVRVLRYEASASINHMPIEKIARASADQRAGRCGRTGNGICIRLYSEKDYTSRPQHSAPEIKRADLGSLILRIHQQRLIEPAAFPFINRPDQRVFREVYRRLRELGAMNNRLKLTRLGQTMAQFPLEPPIACMLLRAREYNVVYEVMIIAAALSSTNPLEVIDGGDESRIHIFRHRESDFMTYLTVWEKMFPEHNQYHKGAYLRVRKFAQEYELQYMRLQEWIDAFLHLERVYQEFRGSFKRLYCVNGYEQIHTSLVSGLVHGIAVANSDRKSYHGIGSGEIYSASSAVTARRHFPWVLFHQLVETGRIYGVRAARIEPEWIETLFKQQCHYRYEDPWFDEYSGEVMVRECVSFQGLTLVKNRQKICRLVDRTLACSVFIREALIQERVGKRYPFIRHNGMIKKKILSLEQKLRIPLYGGDDVLELFYEENMSTISSRHELNTFLLHPGFRKKCMIPMTGLLTKPLPEDPDEFPDVLVIGPYRLNVAWKHKPGEEDDGATITVPDTLYAILPSYYWEWALPVLERKRRELFIDTIIPFLIKRNIDPADIHDMIHQHVFFPLAGWLFSYRTYINENVVALPETFSDKKLCPAPCWWPRIAVVNERNIVVQTFRTPYDHKKERKLSRSIVIPEGFPHSYSREITLELLSESNMTLLTPVASATSAQLVPCMLYHGLVYNNNRLYIQSTFFMNRAYTWHADALVRLCEQRCAEGLAWEIESMFIPEPLEAAFGTSIGISNIREIAIRLLLNSVLVLPEVLPDTAMSIEGVITEAQQRVHGSAAAILELFARCITGFEHATETLSRKYKKRKFSGSEQLHAIFKEEVEAYAHALSDPHVTFHYIVRLPEFLELFPERVNAALLDPGVYRKQNYHIAECFDTIKRCASINDYYISVKREKLRLLIEEFRIAQCGIRKTNREYTITVEKLEKQRNALDRMIRDYYCL